MLCKDIISEKRRQRNRQGEIDRETQIGRNRQGEMQKDSASWKILQRKMYVYFLALGDTVKSEKEERKQEREGKIE